MCRVFEEVNFTTDFEITDLGVLEQDVYDIEVDEYHRFVANGVLVHNSAYFTIDAIVEKYKDRIPPEKLVDFLDKFIETKIQPEINNTFVDLADYMNCFQNKMGAKREAIAQSGIWTGKKKYALHVWDLEGVRYEKPKVKVTGIETQKSSTPEVVRDALLEALEILLGGSQEQLRTHVSDFKEKFNQMSIEEIAFPRGVNNVEKYTGSDGMPVKGCPGHVKAAIAFNRLLNKVNDPTLQPIGSGSKIKFVALMEPNPLQSNSFAFEDNLPKSMEIVKKYVDYDQQFETAFINPLKSLATAVGWSLEDVSCLDDFFG